MAGALAAAPPQAHLPGLALGLAGTAAVLSVLGDTTLVPVLAVAMLLGALLVLLDFGFTGGFRSLLVDRDGRTLGASFIVPAVAALVILPVGTLAEGYGRFVAPIGPPLVVGAAVFGIGMQITNGCGSGTLVAAGQGSRRMWVALPFFCLGGVLGSLVLPAALRLPDLGTVDLPVLLGPWAGLAATEALLLAGALLVLRGARPRRDRLLAGAAIGAAAALLFLVSGLPWGITMGLTLWGAQTMQALGADLTGFAFWSGGWTREALEGPLLALHGSLSDLGLLLGALLAAAAQGRLRHGVPIGWRGALGAAIGGLLMGVGARLSFGCNVGAFLGGASSGSLHGFVWMLAAMPGCWAGIRLRPLFGLR
ncbi:YeeE/YedE family protein [Roseomonas frigidaquae]|uniref:YeeE/YedE family protein n=1 Tax=Falsiroseomonas frigidaquae TaxID=487318 RepID=A0ABX1EUR9_9PROT|nr:YeeE/YedE thiosulfate transporter family protein [Falsiroseomonas frigidaquae]NKE43797.1 YeeE/YedE family protein [Falsiroseomonas frigidaquae]